MRTSYLGTPNQYRFVRETTPFIVDVGIPGPYVQVLSGVPNLTMVSFATFEMQDLANFTDFDPLFTAYHLDKVEVIMQPQWATNVALAAAPDAGYDPIFTIPNLAVTRVSTAYVLNNPVPANADAARLDLAQLQMKSRSLYGSKRPLKLVTRNPKVSQNILSATGTNVAMKSPGWLNLDQSADQRFLLNDRMYVERLDGKSFPITLPIQAPSIYLYRVYFKAHFRCSRVK